MNLPGNVKYTGLRSAAFLVPFFAAVLFASISLVNHFLYRTYFNDLGLYTNAMYNYIHGNWDRSLIFSGGEHIDLWLIIFSPLSLLFGTYTLLLIQIAFIVAGGIGVKRFVLHVSADNFLALLAQVQFYLSFGILTALSFDYHSNVGAAMLVPWLFVFLKEERWLKATVVFVLILAAKESMAFWMIFISSGMLLATVSKPKNGRSFSLRIDTKEQKRAKVLAVYFAVSVCYFFFLTQWFMPRYSFAVMKHLDDYSLLGGDPVSAVRNFFSDPAGFAKAIFTNHTQMDGGDYIKSEFLVLLFISGGWILLVRPIYLWMCLPLLAQKMLNDHMQFWGVGGHYAIEFVPLVSIALFEFFALRQKRTSAVVPEKENTRKQIRVFALIAAALSAGVSFRVCDNTIAFIDKAAIRFYQERHYKAAASVHIKEAFAEIPGDAALSVQSHLAPHLALRKDIYLFPETGNATHILLELNRGSFYPISKPEMIRLKDSLLFTNSWKSTWEKDSILILQREL